MSVRLVDTTPPPDHQWPHGIQVNVHGEEIAANESRRLTVLARMRLLPSIWGGIVLVILMIDSAWLAAIGLARQFWHIGLALSHGLTWLFVQP